MNCPNLYGQYKKNPYGKKYKILSEKLASFFKRSQFCFRPDTLVVAEVDVLPYCQCTTAPSWVYSFRRRHCSAICDEGFNFAAYSRIGIKIYCLIQGTENQFIVVAVTDLVCYNASVIQIKNIRKI